MAHFRSGVIAAKLGAVNDAIKEYESSQSMLAELAKADPAAIEPCAQLAVSHNNLGLLYAARSETNLAASRICRCDSHPTDLDPRTRR